MKQETLRSFFEFTSNNFFLLWYLQKWLFLLRKNINNKKKCCIKSNIFFKSVQNLQRDKKKNYTVKDNIALRSEHWAIKCRVFIIGWVFVLGEKKTTSGCIQRSRIAAWRFQEVDVHFTDDVLYCTSLFVQADELTRTRK